MTAQAWAAALGAAAAIVVCSAMDAPVRAQQARGPLPFEPLGTSDEAIFPAFEGWGPLQDGERVFLLGYYNRNKRQPLDIPIGPDNRIEPGGPDRGQPTHFETGRQHGVFAIRVPKDFGTGKLTWTLTANGQTLTQPSSPRAQTRPSSNWTRSRAGSVTRFLSSSRCSNSPRSTALPVS